ncbi:ABC transporter substrate-binding protein [Paenibacillus eucommiae]|uniref:Multiple sugar transport system substrate-binding protein n=1 Tax=Paenibacillus eucommiae TaxID=1355755 RepID=A0ABS4IQ55_9BACL|nr:extracellular solute-binding protein [Paenibacillus eucommiae]MBP1988739.1 multiple sugar transport system substrate-binding protein [Paenibacillus eucommiae]
MTFKWTVSLSVFMVALMLISGCKEKGEVGQQEQKSVTILYQDEYSFPYRKLVEFKFPELHIEFISYSHLMESPKMREELLKFVDEKKPDLIVLPQFDLQYFEDMLAQGYLMNLSTYIVKNSFDMQKLMPSVVDLLKQKGDGQLYGLTTSFRSKALFYNVDLFNQYGIEHPHDQMSYKEVLELAARFPGDGGGDQGERVFGYHQLWMTPTRFVLAVGEAERLNWYDETPSVTINTGAWKNIFQYVLRGYQTGAIFDAVLLEKQLEETSNKYDYSQAIEESKQRNLFATGRAAMTVSSPGLIGQIMKFKPEMNWDVVTVPVDPANPELTDVIEPGPIMGIYANSANKEEAWKLLAFMNGDEVAKIQAKSERYSDKLPMRTSYIDPNSKQMDAFYKLQIDERPVSTAEIPGEVYNILDREIQQVLLGRKPLDEALQTIQEQASMELIRAKNMKEVEGK